VSDVKKKAPIDGGFFLVPKKLRLAEYNDVQRNVLLLILEHRELYGLWTKDVLSIGEFVRAGCGARSTVKDALDYLQSPPDGRPPVIAHDGSDPDATSTGGQKRPVNRG
jgi:hypothetical protein